jgi:hypothetical protein
MWVSLLGLGPLQLGERTVEQLVGGTAGDLSPAHRVRGHVRGPQVGGTHRVGPFPRRFTRAQRAGRDIPPAGNGISAG